MSLEFEFVAPVFEWRGPAPHLFVALPVADAEVIRSFASALTYGWGVIPVTATVGRTTFTTSLFPRDGTYLLGLKVVVRKAEGIGIGDVIGVRLETGPVV